MRIGNFHIYGRHYKDGVAEFSFANGAIRHTIHRVIGFGSWTWTLAFIRTSFKDVPEERVSDDH